MEHNSSNNPNEFLNFSRLFSKEGSLLKFALFAASLLALTFVQKASAAENNCSTKEGLYACGNKIYKDGKVFVTRGLIFEGFINPLPQLIDCVTHPETPKNYFEEIRYKGEDISTIFTNTYINADGKSFTFKYPQYCVLALQSRDFLFGKNDHAGITNRKNPSYLDGNDAITLGKKNWGLNSLRFNLNQKALADDYDKFPDRNIDENSYTYTREIRDVVKKVTGENLVVYLALFSGANNFMPKVMNELNPNSPMNTLVTLKAARLLAKLFGDYKNVVIEFMNEPTYPAGPLDKSNPAYLSPLEWDNLAWNVYVNGGMLNNSDCKNPDYQNLRRCRFNTTKYIGLKQMISEFRRAGGNNLIGIQAIRGIEGLEFVPNGVAQVLESLGHSKIFFSAHPFFVDGSERTMNFYKRFGAFAARHPFVFTAWNIATPSHDKSLCKDQDSDHPGPNWHGGLQKVFDFLKYADSKKIGLIGYAFDKPTHAVDNFTSPLPDVGLDAPSKLAFDEFGNVNCDARSSGGEYIQDLFLKQSSRETRTPYISTFLSDIPTNTPPIIQKISSGTHPIFKEKPHTLRTLYLADGEEVTLNISATDHSNTLLSYRVWWGDGTVTPSNEQVQTSGQFAHVYPHNSSLKTIRAVVFDELGARDFQEISLQPVSIKILGPKIFNTKTDATYKIDVQGTASSDFSYRLWWGDATHGELSVSPSPGGTQKGSSFKHRFRTNSAQRPDGVFMLSGVVFDKQGTVVGRAKFPVTVTP